MFVGGKVSFIVRRKLTSVSVPAETLEFTTETRGTRSSRFVGNETGPQSGRSLSLSVSVSQLYSPQRFRSDSGRTAIIKNLKITNVVQEGFDLEERGGGLAEG